MINSVDIASKRRFLSTPNLFEEVLVVLILIIYATNLKFLLAPASSFDANDFSITETNLQILHFIWYLTYTLQLLLLLPLLPILRPALVANRLSIFLVMFAVISALWSIRPEVSISRGLALIPSSLFGMYLALRLDQRRFLRLLAFALGLCMILSLAFVLLRPEAGISPQPLEGAWRGIFPHRNTLGLISLLNILVVVTLMPSVERWRWLLWADLVLSAFLLLQSGSKSPLIEAAGICGSLILAYLARRRSVYLIPVIALIVLTLCISVLNADLLLEYVGRDYSFSGRVYLWNAIWEAIQANWFLGYGYQAFWTGDFGPAERVWAEVFWQPSQAHNLYLETLLGLGVVGLSLLSGILIVPFVRIWTGIASRGLEELSWSAGYLAFIVILGFVESYLLDANVLTWPLLVATIVRSNSRMIGVSSALNRHQVAVGDRP